MKAKLLISIIFECRITDSGFIEQQLNNRPRAILGFRIPLEVYQEMLEKIEKDREMNIDSELTGQNICVLRFRVETTPLMMLMHLVLGIPFNFGVDAWR